MNETSLEHPSARTSDDHLARIVRLETQMAYVTSALAELQRKQELHHLAMLAGLESLRDRIDGVQRFLMDRQDRLKS